ncbi:MAG: LysR family transcriptional regulator [Anaerovoracaceae bacterium]
MVGLEKLFVREETGAIIVVKDNDISQLEKTILTFWESGIRNILVMTSESRHEKIEKSVAKKGVICISSGLKDEDEMFLYYKTGFEYLKSTCQWIFATPLVANHFTTNTLEQMLASGAKICNPFSHGTIYHPLLIHRDVIQPISQYDGDGGLREAIEHSGIPRAYVETENRIPIFDRPTFKPNLRVRLYNDQLFFGPGSAQLLKLIDKNKSVRVACEQMGISYSKGWKMLKLIEEETETTIVKRQQGGKNGGTAFLTEEGIFLLKKYDLFEYKCEEAMEQIFKEVFGSKDENKNKKND